MSFTSACTVIFLYLIFGVFTWQFWLLLSVESHYNDQKYQKMANVPLVVFLFFWPVSVLMMIYLIYTDKK